MRILHTADWHLGKKLENFSRIEEQKQVLNEIVQIALEQNVDVILIAGDLFDTFNPSSESIELFYKTLKQLTRQGTCPVIAISGNHDSPDRIEMPDPLAKECGIIFLGYPHSYPTCIELDSNVKITNSEKGFMELKVPKYTYPLRILTTPYANEHRLKQALQVENKESDLRTILQSEWSDLAKKHCNKDGVNMLMTHLFVTDGTDALLQEPDDEKPILYVGGAQAIYTENFPEEIQYVALGHLHRFQQIKSEQQAIYYSGSPLSYSFAEANQDKYVIVADIEPNKKAIITPIKLKSGKKLIKLKAEGIKDAVTKLEKHKDDLIELTIINDEYLSAADRKILNQAHSHIITLIPQIKNQNNLTTENQIDLSKSFKELFSEYFTHNKGVKPNERILNLLDEALSEKE